MCAWFVYTLVVAVEKSCGCGVKRMIVIVYKSIVCRV